MTGKDAALELIAEADREIAGAWLSVARAAFKLGWHAETVRAWCRAKRIPCVRSPTGRYRIPRVAVDALLSQINTQNTQTR